MTSIGASAFNGCSVLRSVTLPFVGKQKGNNGSKEASFGFIFGENYYDGGLKITQRYSGYNNSWFYIPATLRTVKITNETCLGYGAFQNCAMLTSLVINAGAKNNVGEKAFDNTVSPTWI